MTENVTLAPAAAPVTNPTPAAPAAVSSPSPVQTPPAAPVAAAPPAVVPPSPPEAPSTPAPVTTEAAPAATSLLGAEAPKDAAPAAQDAATEAAKPAEGTETKKEDGSQSADPAPLPTFEAFKLPDGMTVDGGKLGEFTKELAEFETRTKADHASMQEFGQKLMDRHVAEVQGTVERLNDYYKSAFEKQRNDWKEAFEKDSEIGGNRAETSVNAALQFIRTHGGTEAHQAEFRALMDSTGVGNHPALIRILAKANAVLGEGKPLPGVKPPAAPQGKAQRRYSGMQTN